jgi:hypothetical protein
VREPVLVDVFAGNPWADMPDEELDDTTVDLTTDGAEYGARLDSNLYDALAPASHVRRSTFSATTSETGVVRRDENVSPEPLEGVDEPGEDQENDRESLHGLSAAALARLFDFEPALDGNGLGRFRVERGTRDASAETDRWNLDASMDMSNNSAGGSGEGTSAASASASAASSSSTVTGLVPRRPLSAGSQAFRQSSVRRNRFRAGDSAPAPIRRRLANRELSLATGGIGSAWARWEVDSDDGQPSSSLYTRTNRRPTLPTRSGLGAGSHFREMQVYRRLMREGERDLRRNWAAADPNTDLPPANAEGDGAGPSNVPSASGSSSATTVTPTAVGPAGLYFHPDNPPIETTGLLPPPALHEDTLSSLNAGTRRRVPYPFPPRDLARGAYYRSVESSLFGMDEPLALPADEVDELIAMEMGRHSPLTMPRGPTPGLGGESLASASVSATGTLSALGERGGAIPGDQLLSAYPNLEGNSRVRDGPGSAGATPRARPFSELLPEGVISIGLESWRQSPPPQQSLAQGRQLLHSPSREDEADAASVAALLQG